MIGIKKQTAWYTDRANELQTKIFKMRVGKIVESFVLSAGAFELLRIDFDNLGAMNFTDVINSVPKDQRWYPVKKFQDPLFCDEVKNVRKFTHTINIKEHYGKNKNI